MAWIVHSPEGKCTGYSLKQKKIEVLQFSGRVTAELVKPQPVTYGLHFFVQPFQSLARILVFCEHFRMSKLQSAETLNIFISLWNPTLLLQSQSMTQSSDGIFQLLVDSMIIDEEREKMYMILKKIICWPGDEISLKIMHQEVKGYFISIL